MKKIKSVARVVKEVLEERPDTRNSDTLLYLAVCQKYDKKCGNYPFSFITYNREQLGLPKTETVRRARQKIRNEFPELDAIDSVIDERYENYKAVRKFAVS